MPIAGLVADANVLLSAAIGKAALRVFRDFRIIVHTTSFNYLEVQEYLPRLAGKYGIPLDVAESQLNLLPLAVHSEETYAGSLLWARTALAARDPEDAHALALAREMDLPLWSNDRDLQITQVHCYTTAALLKALDS